MKYSVAFLRLVYENAEWAIKFIVNFQNTRNNRFVFFPPESLISAAQANWFLLFIQNISCTLKGLNFTAIATTWTLLTTFKNCDGQYPKNEKYQCIIYALNIIW